MRYEKIGERGATVLKCIQRYNYQIHLHFNTPRNTFYLLVFLHLNYIFYSSVHIAINTRTSQIKLYYHQHSAGISVIERRFFWMDSIDQLTCYIGVHRQWAPLDGTFRCIGDVLDANSAIFVELFATIQTVTKTVLHIL